mgnify:CR=1 FL=1
MRYTDRASFALRSYRSGYLAWGREEASLLHHNKCDPADASEIAIQRFLESFSISGFEVVGCGDDDVGCVREHVSQQFALVVIWQA